MNTRRNFLALGLASVVAPQIATAQHYRVEGGSIVFPSRFAPTDVNHGLKLNRNTIVINTGGRYLYYARPNRTAIRFPIAVGREGDDWRGNATVGRKRQWPSWHPTDDMREDDPSLPEVVEGGPRNPLGARALYLYANGRDTLYRIHGTNNPRSIGTAASSGCIRMFNEHVIQLYNMTSMGTPVQVL